jgi:hypothetical protein
VIYKLCGDMNPMESYCHATLGPKKWWDSTMILVSRILVKDSIQFCHVSCCKRHSRLMYLIFLFQ